MNISEGVALEKVAAIAMLAGPDLLDVHSDPDHNRSVITMAGNDTYFVAARDVAKGAVTALDIRSHSGVHPRLGVVDVVPFVPLDGSSFNDAIAARDQFAQYAADELGVPCFLYGTGRSLPELRRGAFKDFGPDFGPPKPHETAGAMCVGAREALVAYNVVLRDSSLDKARKIAAAIRSEHVRALGMPVGSGAQVSMNLISPSAVGPMQVFDQIASMAETLRCELVGLMPANVLGAIPRSRWEELDLDPSRTIEAQIAARNRRLANDA